MPPFAKLAVVVCFCLATPSAGLVVEDTDYYDEDDYYNGPFDLPDLTGAFTGAYHAVAGFAEKKIKLVGTVGGLAVSVTAAIPKGHKAVIQVVCDAAIKIAVADTLGGGKVAADAKAVCAVLAPAAVEIMSDLLTVPIEPVSFAILKTVTLIVGPVVETGFAKVCEPQIDKVVKASPNAEAAMKQVTDFINTGLCEYVAGTGAASASLIEDQDGVIAAARTAFEAIMQAAEQNEAAFEEGLESNPCDKKGSCPDGTVKISLPNGFDGKTVQWSCKCFELPKKKGNVLSEDDYAEVQQPFQVQPQMVYADYYQLAAPIQQMEAPPMVYR